jgi:hypothetical protein
VIRGGTIVAELEGDRMTEENVLTAAFAEGADHPKVTATHD